VRFKSESASVGGMISLGLVHAHAAANAGEVLNVDVLTLGASHSWSRMHQLEGKISHQLATNGTAVEGNANAVGDDDTEGIIGVLALGDEGGRGQVGVGVLDFAVEGNATDILVGSSRWAEEEALHKVASRGDGAALLALHASNIPGEVSVGHGDLYMLHHAALDALDSLAAAVGDVQVGSNLFTMVVDVLLEGDLKVELAIAEGETLGHQGGWLAVISLRWGILDLADSQGHTVALVQLLVGGISHENSQLVQDTEGLGRFIALQNNRGWSHLGQSHGEGVGIASQFLHQTILHLIGCLILRAGVDLLGCQLHLFAELEAHDLIFLSAETVHHGNRGEHFSAPEVVIVD